jgi:hypothetical protein
MAQLADAVPDNVEGNYGWCGLCQSFTVFPHECLEEERPAQEEAT